MENITIRVAYESEHHILCRIWEDAVRHTHHFLSPEDFGYYRERIPEYLRQLQLYVAVREGKIMGFSGIADRKLEMLFVGERGCGIGTILLRHAVGQNDVDCIDVNEQNLAAVDFYSKAGFETHSRSEADAEGKPYPILHLVRHI